MRRSVLAPALALALAAGLLAVCSATALPVRVFESGHARPLVITSDGQRLLAVNTPDARLEVFHIDPTGKLSRDQSIAVGLEPIAVALRNDNEAWVVNHVSDSVSIVDLASTPARVRQTILIGDEPGDIVFAGPRGDRAFITTAHRGQNHHLAPELFTPGIGRADVWVFDAAAVAAGENPKPLTILSLFGDTPRALAKNADGSRVYAAVFRSGNRTTAISWRMICLGTPFETPCEINGRTVPGGPLPPYFNAEGVLRPNTSFIVKGDDSGAWRDVMGRDWRNGTRLSLPDKDVFEIDAMADPPQEVRAFPHVGTVLYGMAVHPQTGDVFVANTEANNMGRFTGRGVRGNGTLIGHLHESRLTVLRPSGEVEPHRLNPHIDYATVPSPPQSAERSLGLPVAIAMANAGQKVLVAAMGSDKLAILDSDTIVSGTLQPDTNDHVTLSGGGPSGIAVDEIRGRAFVSTRFDNGISTVDLARRLETGHLTMHNPEPPAVSRGRRFFYDARYTSSNGEAACASCHIFGDTDHLAWDLGDADAPVIPNPNPFRELSGAPPPFHPLKGPMTTQTLRGIDTLGPMHWRGDRTGAFDDPSAAFDERAALLQFNEAFVNLMGRASMLTNTEMDALADFVLAILPAPNPIRALDQQLNPIQEEGKATLLSSECSICHRIDPERGWFGTDGSSSRTDANEQVMKIPRLDQLYQKVGMFVMVPDSDGEDTGAGDQVRGFGFLNDGAYGMPPSDPRPNLEYLFAGEARLAPIVGQQISMTSPAAAEIRERFELLNQRAAMGECELIAHAAVDGELRGWLRTSTGDWQSDRSSAMPQSQADLLGTALEFTFTCVPPGEGTQRALDRDGDGNLDGDERDAGTRPDDPLDPVSPTPPPSPTATPTIDAQACGGDCNRDGVITVDEVVRGVRLLLDDRPVTACASLDVNGDDRASVDELVAAVVRLIDGC